MMLLNYLSGIISEHRFVKEIQTNGAYFWFLYIGLTEKVSNSTTLTKTANT
ncbi:MULTISPECIES: transposase [Providencia]|uniref:transposase n=1 Tax=Providencia TaxID=586 RepID=UPI0013A64D15|nr:transposase [Providencia rettgeri]QIF56320.1 transposase [Providencia sp. 1701011]EIJ7167443.1 transposase [Providencia rettgeri]MBQ0399447.1 transposase [Providencia rettgeri]MBS0917800.1 transposase [Providencia rettgeri]